MICRLLAVAVLAFASSSSESPAGWWSGSYTLAGLGTFTVRLADGHATVALGPGHAGTQVVPAATDGPRVRFALPGRPAAILFEGAVVGSRLRGTVRQGPNRGTFAARRGQDLALLATGVYGSRAVVDDPYGPARLVDLGTGAVNAVYPSGRGFVIGSGFATRAPSRGPARLGQRERTRQLEVQFRSGDALLSGTLTVPASPGRHPAVAFVAGSGETTRAYLPDLQAALVHDGVAVLAYDKRGVGQSGGVYPGESPTPGAIDVLARDASAAVRFLARQPEVDRARIGLAGHSQAGWIVPLAASRTPAVHFAVLFSAPAVTAGETDLYQTLTGQGEQPQAPTDAAIDAQVAASGRGGVDPLPWIRKLRIPALWLYGGRDEHIPARLSVRRLDPVVREQGRDFALRLFPNGNHALVETKTGLTSEMLRSDRFAPGLFAALRAWLGAHGLR
jgi:dienelactone hydrolase